MPAFQLLGCQIDLGGNRDSVIVRSRYAEPVTYPEYLLLQVIHGGAEHVHHAMSVGEVIRTDAEEAERLTLKYGEAIVQQVFPGAGQSVPLPRGNEGLPSEEEVNAGEEASKKARAAARAKRAKKEPVPGFPEGADRVPELPA